MPASLDDLVQREKQFGVTETAAPPVPTSTVPAQLSQAPDRVKALSEAGVKLVDKQPLTLTAEQVKAGIGPWEQPAIKGLVNITEQVGATDKVVLPTDKAGLPTDKASLPAPQVRAKRVGSLNDLQALEATRLHGKTAQEYTEEQDDELGFVDPLDQAPSDTSEPASAFLAGAARGAMGLVTGPVQFTLEQTAPETAVQFTNQVNDWEERLGMVEAARRSPISASAGEVAGTVAGVMATAGMLGATTAGEAIGQVAQYVPRILRGAGVGAVAGATTFHQDIEEGNRWLEGALGAVFGGAGQTIGSTLGWATRYLANRDAFQKYLAVLQGSVGSWSRNLSGVKDAFLEHYRGLTEEANRLYEVRNQSGQAFAGFDADRLSRAVSDAIPSEARKAGVATTVTANKVKDELGLYQHEAAKKAHAEAVRDWEKAERKWQEAANGIKVGGRSMEGMPQAVREKVIQEYAHVLPPRPLPPGEFVPKPVTSNRFAAALQAVHRAREATKEPQTRHQLSALEKELFSAAKEAAEQHGMPVDQFLRDMVRANRFFAENIGPIRDLFNKMGPERVARKFTNAQMADMVSRALGGGKGAKGPDVELLRKLGSALGPRAKVDMTKVAMKEMLDRLTEGMKGRVPQAEAVSKFSKYVQDRKEGLQALLGRQHVEELEGFAKLGEQLVGEKPARRLWGWGTHSFLPWIGIYEVIEGASEGDLHKVQRGGMLMVAPFAVHALHDTFIKMYELPYMLPMVRAAAKYKPGSVEFERLVRQIETRAIGVGAVTGRVTQQDTLTEAP